MEDAGGCGEAAEKQCFRGEEKGADDAEEAGKKGGSRLKEGIR